MVGVAVAVESTVSISSRSAQTSGSTQEDPIGIYGGLNLYGYAAGDPVNNHDPLGLASWKHLLHAMLSLFLIVNEVKSPPPPGPPVTPPGQIAPEPPPALPSPEELPQQPQGPPQTPPQPGVRPQAAPGWNPWKWVGRLGRLLGVVLIFIPTEALNECDPTCAPSTPPPSPTP